MLMHSLLKRKLPLTAIIGNYTSNFTLWKESCQILCDFLGFYSSSWGSPKGSGGEEGKVLRVKHCHCANNSKVRIALSHHFLGKVGCMDGSSSNEASIKLNQHILRIDIQNLGKQEVFLHYFHTSVDDSAFCSREPRLLQCKWQRWCTHDLSTPTYPRTLNLSVK